MSAFSWHRFIAVLVKEFVQMRRDRLTFAMMVGIPIIQLVLFGFAINADPRALPAAVLSADNSVFSRSFVRAVENAAPREEINTIQYGGARYPQAVECGPQRRIDLALRLMVQGAYGKSFGTKRKIEDTLAEEILLAFQADTKSNAVAKKLELERQADASR